MNQEKIGKFIAECRKDKQLTQQELAEKLGVTDKSIGNWENGRNMPDLSLFKPLCDELGITINELLSGEKIESEVYQEKFEENIINTIDYSTKKIKITKDKLAIVVFSVGLLLAFMAMSVFPSESSWGSIYSILGAIVSLVGLIKLLRNLSIVKRFIIGTIYFIGFISLLIVVDFIGVITVKQVPRFCYIKSTGAVVEEFKAPFYTVYRVNRNTENEYYIIDTDKEYTEDTIPVVPFNREKAGYKNIINYKNKYVGNNSNTINLINNLPLSNYGKTFQLEYNDNKNQVVINYHITDWYINDNLYLEKALVYNTVSIFKLIDNADSIIYQFPGKTYTVDKTDVIKNYPNYTEILKNEDTFYKYLENKMNDDDFVDSIFNKIFSVKEV